MHLQVAIAVIAPRSEWPQITISLQSLNDLSLALLSKEFVTREQIDRHCRQHDVKPRLLMEANSLSAVIEIVRHTQLATLLPANIAINRGELTSSDCPVALAPG